MSAAPHASCLYEGFVRHRRAGAVANQFRHRLFMAYLDLDELPELFDGSLLWSARRPAPAWFRRADYLGDPRVALKQATLALVAERTGLAPAGPVRLLTHLRYLGHCFNPVSFYYCFDAPAAPVGPAAGAPAARVAAVVAEVTNTPWGERHAYVMPVGRAHDGGTVSVLSAQLDKRLHVSPLMGMERRYDWRLTEPGRQLLVHIESRPRERERDPGERAEGTFDATLSLRRREIDARALRHALLRHPLMTHTVQAHIYAHALRLRLRGARWFPHPHAGAMPT